MDVRKKLTELLADYFHIGDSYHYTLGRDKEAFGIGTMGLDDFREYSEDDVAEIVEHLIAAGVTIPVRCKDCVREGTEDCPMVHRDPIIGNLFCTFPADGGFCSKGQKGACEYWDTCKARDCQVCAGHQELAYDFR